MVLGTWGESVRLPDLPACLGLFLRSRWDFGVVLLWAAKVQAKNRLDFECEGKHGLEKLGILLLAGAPDLCGENSADSAALSTPPRPTSEKPNNYPIP